MTGERGSDGRRTLISGGVLLLSAAACAVGNGAETSGLGAAESVADATEEATELVGGTAAAERAGETSEPNSPAPRRLLTNHPPPTITATSKATNTTPRSLPG